MSQSDSSVDGTALRWAARLLLGVAILQTGGFVLAFAAMAPPLIVLIPATFVLSDSLFRWLCFRCVSSNWALFCTALAMLSWPWITLFLTCWSAALAAGPKGIDFAWLFGPVVPYAAVGTIGLALPRRRSRVT